MSTSSISLTEGWSASDTMVSIAGAVSAAGRAVQIVGTAIQAASETAVKSMSSAIRASEIRVAGTLYRPAAASLRTLHWAITSVSIIALFGLVVGTVYPGRVTGAIFPSALVAWWLLYRWHLRTERL